MAVSSITLSLPPPTSTLFPRKPLASLTFHNSSFSVRATNPTHRTLGQDNNTRVSKRISATSEDVLPLESTIETTQQLVSAKDDGVSTTISVLLFIAFLGLTVLTIGVVYIAVTDFLQKREKDKFEEEEAAKKSKKKKGKRGAAVRSRTGPRGFGQKIEENDDDDDEL